MSKGVTRKTVKVWEIGYFVMLLSIFKFGYLPNMVTYFYRGIQLLSLIYLALLTIKKGITNYKLILLLFLYYCILGFSTLINTGDGIELIEEELSTALTVLWMHHTVRRSPNSCINILFIAFEIIIYANLLSILLYPEGLYRSSDAVVSARYGWLLGHQSLFAMYASPAICIAGLFYSKSSKHISKIRSGLLVSACVVQIAILRSATNIACLLIILLGTIGMTIFHMKKFPLKALYLAVAILIVVIVVFQQTSFMQQIVANFLNRSSTFTGRTIIWTRTITLLKEKWLLGYGVQSEKAMIKLIGIVHAHDQYLQCIFLGGIPLLIIFLLICSVSFKNIQQYTYTFPGKLIAAAVASLLVQMIFEVYFHHTAGKYLFIFSYYFPQLYSAISKEPINEI